MAKTRAYSYRLQFDDQVDEKIMELLDTLDDSSSENRSAWQREAVRQRYIRETSPEPVKVDGFEAMVMGILATEAGNEEVPLHSRIIEKLNSYGELERTKYIVEAIKLRFIMENHAPAFFIDQYYERKLYKNDENQNQVVTVAEEKEMRRLDSERGEEQNEMPLEAEVIEEPPLHPYLQRCLVALPMFQDLRLIGFGGRL